MPNRSHVRLVYWCSISPHLPFSSAVIHQNGDMSAATSVLEREAELVGRIQAQWRGLSVRRYLIVFRRELRRHREVRASMVYRIQRTVRGWSHRKQAGKRRLRRAEQKILANYVAEKSASIDDDACTDGMARLRRAYITERYGLMLRCFLRCECWKLIWSRVSWASEATQTIWISDTMHGAHRSILDDDPSAIHHGYPTKL